MLVVREEPGKCVGARGGGYHEKKNTKTNIYSDCTVEVSGTENELNDLDLRRKEKMLSSQ